MKITCNFKVYDLQIRLYYLYFHFCSKVQYLVSHVANKRYIYIYISIIASDCSHAHLTNFVMYISLCTFY